MQLFFVDQERLAKHGNRWPMHTAGMMRALGLPLNGHLPAEGMPEREVQGIRVWVTPQEPPRNGWKSSKHRVMCACPFCGQHMSAGRLNQHACKELI